MSNINLHDKEILTSDELETLIREFYYMMSQDARDRLKDSNSVNSYQYQSCSSQY